MIFAGFVLAPGGLVYTAMERWFHLGKYQPIVAGVGVIVSAILNPDGVAVAVNRARAGSRRKARAPLEKFPRRPHRCLEGHGMSPLLEARGLHVEFGGVVAVDDVSFQVDEGTLVGFIGPNGAGKTTCIEALTATCRTPPGRRLRRP